MWPKCRLGQGPTSEPDQEILWELYPVELMSNGKNLRMLKHRTGRIKITEENKSSGPMKDGI